MGTHVLRPMRLLAQGKVGPTQEQTTRHQTKHTSHPLRYEPRGTGTVPHGLDMKAMGTSQPTEGSMVWKTA